MLVFRGVVGRRSLPFKHGLFSQVIYVSFRDPVAFRELYTQGISVVKLAQAGLVCLFGLFRMISLPRFSSPQKEVATKSGFVFIYIYICLDLPNMY